MKPRKDNKFRKFFQRKTVRKFESREACYQYLETEVFVLQDFIANVTETAMTLQISYLLAYEIITNYLTDVLYEIDKAQSKTKQRSRITVYGYLNLDIGFMRTFENKKMFIEKMINLN